MADPPDHSSSAGCKLWVERLLFCPERAAASSSSSSALSLSILRILIVLVDETLEKTCIEYSSLQAYNRFAIKPHRVRDVWHKLVGCLDLISPRERG